jgi:type VI secretion system protein ImpL
VASDNTSVNKQLPPQAFQPVQAVTPPGCFDKPLVRAGNSAYMQSLSALQGALQAVGPIEKADPNNVTAANTAATQALSAINALAFGFAPDPSDPKTIVLTKTTDILRDPITRVPPLLKGAGAGPINAGAGNLCASIAPMLKKYPFNPRSTVDSTLQEVNDFLKPNDGRLWQLYNASLKPFLIPSGSDYVAATGQQLAVTPAFLNFFNRAAHMSQALYGPNDAQPNLTFSMQVLPSQDVTHLTLTIDGQTLSTDLKSGPKSQTFSWPGATPGVSLGVAFGGGVELSIIQPDNRLWALWHSLDSGERIQSSGNQLELQWILKSSAGQTSMINGHPAAVRFALDSQSAQIFRPQYFSGLVCTGKAVQ